MVTHRQIFARCSALIHQPVVTRSDLENLRSELAIYERVSPSESHWNRITRACAVVYKRHLRTSIHAPESFIQSRLDAFMSHSHIEALVSPKQASTTACSRGVSRLASGQSVRRFLTARITDLFGAAKAV